MSYSFERMVQSRPCLRLVSGGEARQGSTAMVLTLIAVTRAEVPTRGDDSHRTHLFCFGTVECTVELRSGLPLLEARRFGGGLAR